MAKVPDFAKAFSGPEHCRMDKRGVLRENTRMTSHAVADQAWFAHAAEFFNAC